MILGDAETSETFNFETTPKRSRLMASIRQKGTSLELAVRKILDQYNVHYETNTRDLPGSPDVASREGMWAIFVHGCFWHAHENCKKATIPKRNRDFWKKKFADNKARDKQKITLLEKRGYSVLVVWECELDEPKKLNKDLHEFLTQLGSFDIERTEENNEHLG